MVSVIDTNMGNLHLRHILENVFCLNFLNVLFSLFLYCVHVCLSEGVRLHGTEVTDSCKLSCGCWELNSSPLEEQVLPLNHLSSSPKMSFIGIFVLNTDSL